MEKQSSKSLIKIPDPVVVKNQFSCKALLVQQSYIIIGFDSGEITIYDKTSLKKLATQKLMDTPILQIQEVMVAILVQFKDIKGSVLVLKPPNAKSQFNLEIVMKLETQVQSFTTITSSYINYQDRQHVMVAIKHFQQMHNPRVYLLNQFANDIWQDIVIQTLKSDQNQNDNSNKDKKSSKSKASKSTKSDLPPQGVLSAVHFTTEGNNHLLLVGYESGAIGGFKIYIDQGDQLKFQNIISIQKLIQDPNTNHVLCLKAIQLSQGCGYFKLAVGYYSNVIQTLDFTIASDNESYLIQTQKIVDHTSKEKQGIGCMDCLIIGNKALLATGCFDHRIKVLSVKTLKQLVNLQFHQGIINSVHLEQKSQNEVTVYGASEDGYLSIWNLQI